MLKFRLFILLLLLAAQGFSQIILEQRLFYLSNENVTDQSGHLYYLDYTMMPQIIQVDSAYYHDFDMFSDVILATGDTSVLYQIPGQLITGLNPLDTILSIDAKRGFYIPNEGYLFLRETSPHFYFEQFTGNTTSLNASDVPPGFVDAMYFGGELFILYPDTLRIVNLDSLATNPVTTLGTPKPFPFGGSNTWIHHLEDIDNIDHIYIIVEYATALMRTSLIEYQPTTQTFDSIFHYNTFSNYYRPLVAGGLLYMQNFNTHYDPITNNVHFNPATWPIYHAVGCGPMFPTFFLHNPSNNMIYMNDGSNPGNLYDSISLGVYPTKFDFWYDTYGSAKETEIQAFPFMTLVKGNRLEVRSDDPEAQLEVTQLYDLQGRLIHSSTPYSSVFSIPLPAQSGIYILKLSSDGKEYVKKIAK